MTLWVGTPQSHTPAKFGSDMHRGSWDNGFSVSHNLARPRDETVIWLYEQEPIKVSYTILPSLVAKAAQVVEMF